MDRPFVYGTAVFGDNFTDRKAETKHLKMNFEAGVNTILVSPRRTGKTSLVYRAMEQIKDPSVKVIMMDVYDCRDEYEFYERFAVSVLKGLTTKTDQMLKLAKEYLSRLSPRIVFSPDPINGVTLSLGINPKTEKPEEVLNIPEVIARKRNIHVVVCIDEFQQIGEFQDSMNIQRKIRGVWQLQKNVSYCLFGSKKHMMDKLFQNKSMPFYHFGDIVSLNLIPKEEWVDFIIERFATRSMTISAEQASKICDLVGGHSSYVQQLAWNVMVEAVDTVKDEDVANGFEQLVRQTSSLFTEQLSSLTAFQMNYLRALDAGINSGFSSIDVLDRFRLGSKSNISRIEQVLFSKELIDRKREGIFFSDPVFAFWFHREYCK